MWCPSAVQGGRSVPTVAAELGLPDRLVRGCLRWASVKKRQGTAPGADTLQATVLHRSMD